MERLGIYLPVRRHPEWGQSVIHPTFGRPDRPTEFNGYAGIERGPEDTIEKGKNRVPVRIEQRRHPGAVDEEESQERTGGVACKTRPPGSPGTPERGDGQGEPD